VPRGRGFGAAGGGGAKSWGDFHKRHYGKAWSQGKGEGGPRARPPYAASGDGIRHQQEKQLTPSQKERGGEKQGNRKPEREKGTSKRGNAQEARGRKHQCGNRGLFFQGDKVGEKTARKNAFVQELNPKKGRSWNLRDYQKDSD